MIGQKQIQEKLKNQIESNKLPRFMIFVGQRGSGKRTLAKWLGKQLNAITIESDIKAEDIRTIIEQAYKVASTTLYILPDVQKMSTVAQNAMLKVTEEPPNRAYFIMTAENENQLLNTLLSRGTVFHLDNYSDKEILEYAESNNQLTRTQRDIILDICETPGEVDIITKYSITDFDDYVRTVIQNIAEVSGSNAFKISQKICLSDKDSDVEKYDLRLFWKAFIVICMQMLIQDPLRYAYGIKTTSKYLQELRITGINKQSTFDIWLLDIRSEWLCKE